MTPSPGAAPALPEMAPPARARADVIGCLARQPSDLFPLLCSLLADEIGRQRRLGVEATEWRGWGPQTAVDESGLGVDSLARLELVARISRYFGLHRTGLEDYLLIHRRLIEWAELALEGFRRLPPDQEPALMFETAGSTGQPRCVTHDLCALVEEVAAHDTLFPASRRIVSLVPPHHIYGFLFTVLAPRMRGLPSLDLRGRAPGAVPALLRPGDLVIATPFLWQLIVDSGHPLPAGVTGVSSTAPMPARLWAALTDRGLGRLVEVYGSTETAGIGTRDTPQGPFAVMPHLVVGREGATQEDLGFRRRSTGERLNPPDALTGAGPGRFRHRGRIDGAVQIGGTNVFPARVADLIRVDPQVAECAVRLDEGEAMARLKAFVVPRGDCSDDAQAQALFLSGLRRRLDAVLNAAERPGRIVLGPTLPRDAMGKLCDWG